MCCNSLQTYHIQYNHKLSNIPFSSPSSPNCIYKKGYFKKMVPSLGIELSSQAYKTRASPFMLWGHILIYVTIFKQQEQSRRTLNSYRHYTVQDSTSKLKKLYTNQSLRKRSQFSVREGKFISTVELLFHLKKMRASRITQIVQLVYSTIHSKSTSRLCFITHKSINAAIERTIPMTVPRKWKNAKYMFKNTKP